MAANPPFGASFASGEPPSGGTAGFLSSPEELIAEARHGRMFILADDEGDQSRGNLVMPAQMATPDAINFMAKHGCGLICLALTEQRVGELALPLISRPDEPRHDRAFTVSIEARQGVSTGISAADRARTVATAIDSGRGAADIVTPGHVFPLVAREGGVLVRAGHTEAAVDIARLAGLNASGVICEIMDDQGTTAPMNELVALGARHGLKLGTIRDLIAYRRRHDHLLEKRIEIEFDSPWGGRWIAICFYNKATGTEQLALVKGEIGGPGPVLVRMHTARLFGDLLARPLDGDDLIGLSMKKIALEGRGVVVIMNRLETAWLSRSMCAHLAGIGSPEMEALRDYGVGAQVLAELGVQDMILLTNSHKTLVALAGHGLSIVGQQPLD